MQGDMTSAVEWVSLFDMSPSVLEYELCANRAHSFWMFDDDHLLVIRIEKKMATA